MKLNLIRKVAAVVCAAGMLTTCMAGSVGAVDFAPHVARDNGLVSKVGELNGKLCKLKDELKKFQKKVISARDGMIKSDIESFGIDDGFDNMNLLVGQVSGFVSVVDKIEKMREVSCGSKVDAMSKNADSVIKAVRDFSQLRDEEVCAKCLNIEAELKKHRQVLVDSANQLANESKKINESKNVNKNYGVNKKDNPCLWYIQDIGVRISDLKRVDIMINDGHIDKAKTRFQKTKLSFYNLFCDLYRMLTNGREYRDDCNQEGRYIGQYSLLERLKNEWDEIREKYNAYFKGQRKKPSSVVLDMRIQKINGTLDEIEGFIAK